ncbi:MAG: response regulator [Acidobacteria bacterium]|nr:response regulator [Acidobacteriota bacterium]
MGGKIQLSSARYLAYDAEGYLRERSDDLRVLSSRVLTLRHNAAAATIQDLFKRFTKSYVSHVSLHDTEGKITFSTSPQLVGLEALRPDFFQWAESKESQEGVFVSSLPIKNATPGARLAGRAAVRELLLSFPLVEVTEEVNSGSKRQLLGALSMAIDLNALFLNHFVGTSLQSKPEAVWLMDDDGNLLLQTEHPEMEGRNFYLRDDSCKSCHNSFEYIEKMLAKKRGTLDYRVKGHPNKLAAFQTIDFANRSWLMVLNIPLDQITAFQKKEHAWVVWLLIVVAATVGVSSTALYKGYRSKERAEEEAKHWKEKHVLQEKIQESELLYQAIFDQSPDGIVIIDSETALPLAFNTSAHRQLGYTRDEFWRLRICDYEALESPQETKAHMAQIVLEKTDDFETKHRTKEGHNRDVRVIIQGINLSGKPAAGLTRQLLTFSRKQVLQQAPLDLNAIILDMEKMLGRLIGEDVNLMTRLEPGLGLIRGDPGQIEQVIMNLAVNARDAMPSGGKLIVETANVVLNAGYAQKDSEVKPGPYVLLAVSDTGCGMTWEVKSHLFEPFFTTKGPGKGTGLGLATVYGIIKQSVGHIEVYSEVGTGTTFKLYFPFIGEQGELGTAPVDARTMPQGTETILVAEDDDAVREMARYVLKSCGYTVLEAGNGEEALRIGEKHDGPVHLLVTDVVMPELDGPTVSERLSLRRPEIKVLFLSGYTDEAVTLHGVRHDTWPFSRSLLVQRLLQKRCVTYLDFQG